MKFHNKNTNDVLQYFNTRIVGLTSKEVEQRLKKDGKNELIEEKRDSVFKYFIMQFHNVLIYVLLIATILTFLVGDYLAGAIILAIVIINAIVGVFQEEKASKALANLKKLTIPKAIVKRDGKIIEIEASNLVTGDIVVLKTGSQIPADLRLIEVNNLQIEESSLTGESVSITKDTKKIEEENINIGDCKNLAYMSTYVTYGRGLGVVVATGMNTEIGKIATILTEHKKEETPLQKRLNELGKIIGLAVVIISFLVFIIHLLYQQPWKYGFDYQDAQNMFVISISLAVAAIPEGLVAIVAVVLAIGTLSMSRKNAIVKTLPAVETLGSVSVICSDKTGTLTENKMTVTKLFTNNKYSSLDIDNILTKYEEKAIEGLALCNDANSVVGDPTEQAFIHLANKYKIDVNSLNNTFPRIQEIPFDSKRKMMSTVHKNNNKYLVYTKGALDILLNNCTHIILDDSIKPLDEKLKIKILTEAEKMSNDALRVLAISYKELTKNPKQNEIENNLILLGLVGLMDPPRQEVKSAIKKCNNAGIKVVMITGDHLLTAEAIAKDLNILTKDNLSISGDQLDLISDEKLFKDINKYSVFARVSPEHKVRIVKAFQNKGHIVSMTGDGVNDAPALKVSNIGVSMGITGTDVTKSASDLVLTDDNFTTIVNAVESGRNIYNNIKKSIFFLLSCNLGEVLTVLLAVLFNWPVPLLAIQILWINLITDALPAISLGMDLPSNDVMSEAPRSKDESLFAQKRGLKTIITGSVIGIVSLLAFIIGMYVGGISFNDFSSITQHDNVFKYASTLAFIVLSLSQLILAYSMRNEKKLIINNKPFKNKQLNYSFIIGLFTIFIIFLIPPLKNTFGLKTPKAIHLLYILAISMLPFIVNEILKKTFDKS